MVQGAAAFHLEERRDRRVRQVLRRPSTMVFSAIACSEAPRRMAAAREALTGRVGHGREAKKVKHGTETQVVGIELLVCEVEHIGTALGQRAERILVAEPLGGLQVIDLPQILRSELHLAAFSRYIGGGVRHPRAGDTLGEQIVSPKKQHARARIGQRLHLIIGVARTKWRGA